MTRHLDNPFSLFTAGRCPEGADEGRREAEASAPPLICRPAPSPRRLGEESLPRAARPFPGFARLLRRFGFAVAPEQAVSFMRAVALLGPRSMNDIREAALAMLAPPPDRRAEFDAHFRAYFHGEAAATVAGEPEEETAVKDDGDAIEALAFDREQNRPPGAAAGFAVVVEAVLRADAIGPAVVRGIAHARLRDEGKRGVGVFHRRCVGDKAAFANVLLELRRTEQSQCVAHARCVHADTSTSLRRRSLRLAARELLQSGQAFAPGQLRHDVDRRQPQMRHRHHGMEPQVGEFAHQGLAVRFSRVGGQILGGHHRLSCFLADLFQDGIGALVEQTRHIALVGVAALAGLDDGSQSREDIQRIGL